MLTLEELLSSKIYWMETIQNDIFRELDSYMRSNGLSMDELASLIGASNSQVRKLLNGEFRGTVEEMVEIMLKIGKVPKLRFITVDEEMRNREEENKEYEPLMTRGGRSGPYFQMQDVLLACGEGLNKRERAAILWLLGKANEMHEAYERERRARLEQK